MKLFPYTLDAFNKFDGGVRQVVGVQGTAGIFSTFPHEGLSMGNGVLDQVKDKNLDENTNLI